MIKSYFAESGRLVSALRKILIAAAFIVGAASALNAQTVTRNANVWGGLDHQPALNSTPRLAPLVRARTDRELSNLYNKLENFKVPKDAANGKLGLSLR